MRIVNQGNEDGCIPPLFGLFVNWPLTIVLRGVTLVAYWSWFIVPLGLAAIGFWHALGLSSLLALLTHQVDLDKEDGSGYGWRRFERGLVYIVCLYGFALLFGWFNHRMM